MPKASTKRVQCPDPTCGKIQKTRGQHYFVCDECRTTFDIEPNRYEDGDSNSKHTKHNGQDSGRHKPQRDMGQDGRQGSDSREDPEGSSGDSVERDTPESEGLEFG